MNSRHYTYIVVSFVLYTLAQVLLIKNLALYDFALCFAYTGFLLLFPIDTGKITFLIVGFVTGFVIDIFYDMPGINAAACVLLTYMRPLWLQVVTPRGGYEDAEMPTVRMLGLQWFIIYALPLIFAHHCLLFYAEAGGFQMFWFTLLKVFATTAFTFVVVVMVQYLFYRRTS